MRRERTSSLEKSDLSSRAKMGASTLKNFDMAGAMAKARQPTSPTTARYHTTRSFVRSSKSSTR
jgi:hypothetical protein